MNTVKRIWSHGRPKSQHQCHAIPASATGTAARLLLLLLLPILLWSTIPSVLHSYYRRGAMHRAKQRHEYTFRAIANQEWRPDDVLIVAHRGCIARFPENTLAAIAACSEEGAHVAEIDLERTLDGHLILMHDDTIERTTNRRQWLGTSAVANYTLEQLQSDFWSVQNEYTGVVLPFRIPTFSEALQTAKRCGVHLYIDIKERYHIEQLAVEEIHKADAFDHVLLEPLQLYQPPPEYAAQIRYVQWFTNYTDLCTIRKTTNTGHLVSVMWDGGEYFLRDPKKLRQDTALQALLDKASKPTHPPCIHTTNMEDTCLGAHLYQPVAQATCARLLMTDLPGTARAALLASRQMATMRVYPLESTPAYSDGRYHRIPPLPTCLAPE
jgi:glycerophosphoryl diester phosphodiesterase